MDFIVSWYHHSYSVTKTSEFQIMKTQLLFVLLVCFLQFSKHVSVGYPGGTCGTESACQCRRHKRRWFNPWVRKIPWRRDGCPLQRPWASLVAQLVKNLPAVQETWVPSLGWEDPPKEEMVTHSSIFAGKIPWTEEGCRLQSMRLQEVRHD